VDRKASWMVLAQIFSFKIITAIYHPFKLAPKAQWMANLLTRFHNYMYPERWTLETPR
jgi:hypothetical protein